jgi:CRISPR-associated protein Csx3
MDKINLLPAILIAGPPHCGKSVLSFMLTQDLRLQNTAHYLLRAAPDGEGDWFHQGSQASMMEIRLGHKRQYTPAFTTAMRKMIEERMLPLLVDVGGKPRGEDQFAILRTCTHSIVLYREETDLRWWRDLLAGMHLIPVAEIRSDLGGKDGILTRQPFFKGVISGLERSHELRRAGETYAAVLDLVKSIFSFSENELAQIHLSRAPYPPLLESEMALNLGLRPPGEYYHWKADDLKLLDAPSRAARPAAIYGRGPSWLAAALASAVLPAPAAIFDLRLGWVELTYQRPRRGKEVAWRAASQSSGDLLLEIELPANGQLTIRNVPYPDLRGEGGLLLSGKLPRWYFAALARFYAPRFAWVAVYDAREQHFVTVTSRVETIPAGTVIRTDAPPAR